MKKYILLTIVFFALTVGPAMATELAATTTGDGANGGETLAATTPAAGDIAKMSKGVRLAANYDGQGYAMVTKHNNGTKQYGSADDSTAIFSEVVDKTAAPETPDAASNTFFSGGDGWTSL